ncbi:MAG: efflux RND transporter periplasmic adaptor subunit [candidate division KSB1 bacterium]|nr:efflux RND transporter periplasmic adaptor subunit [candidate division KSB1 bacterium]MDZ7301232.1 efflux RND transporter periplasmic adaptor subunit [candidate division KSB1 bacterium]MDZ7310544.1 efflux RND transporter periplasmic adaptor subunit [candidate division KSB1 bacterium]
MKKIALTAIISIALGLAAGWFFFRPAKEGGATAERKILFYRDPMNPERTSPTPMKSSDGMDFVPVYAEAEKETNNSGERKILYYKDPMHPWLTSPKPGKAPDCGMDMVPVYEGETEEVAGSAIKIDPTVVQNIGVRTEEVQKIKMRKVIRTVGKIEVDETKLYDINTRIMGWVEKLYVNVTGQPVQKGQPLLELYSPELVSTQEEYLLALRYQKATSGSEVQEAVAGSASLVESARRRLELWDISDREIAELERTGKPRRTLMFYSPADGIVMEKMIVQGAAVMPGMKLFQIADLSTIWVIADVYEYELPWVKVGQPAEMELAYIPGKIFSGKVTYLYPMLSMETRTAKVRLEFANPRSRIELRPEMFASVRIVSEMGEPVIAVPEQAIIPAGPRRVAIVALSAGYFEPREVKVGRSADGYLEILEGLQEGEQLVISSQFLIDSASNLRSAVAQFTSGHAGHGGMQTTPKGEREKGRVGEGEQSEEHKGHQMPSEEHKGHQMQDSGSVSGHSSHDMGKVQSAGAKKYTCEMHPEVIMDAPGDCPKCGMKLVEMK